MFEFHLGDKLSVPSTLFKDPVFLTGRAGQGKSVTFLKVVFELIRNNQCGLILDPYGDLARQVKEKSQAAGLAGNLVFGDFNMSLAELRSALEKGKMVVAASRILIEGERKSRDEGIKFLKRYFKCAKKGQWLLIDEAFSFLDDDILADYLSVKKKGLYVMFCDQGFSKLSEKERVKFGKLFGACIIYKVGNFDAICLAKCLPLINPKNVAAIQQFHFQFVHEGKVTYHKGAWPLHL